MKLATLALALVLGAAAAPAAKAVEGKALELRPKAAFAAELPGSPAPFVAAAPAPHLDFAPREAAREANPSSCENGHLVCYDGANGGHLVFKPARRLMPEIPGLRAENLTVKRDRIVLHYSFW
jgi:hypothetical protein